jgi:hypothetical protein
MTRLLAAAPGGSVDAGGGGETPPPPAKTTGIASDAATELLSDIGFLLVPGAPFDRGPAYLMIALRPRPTLAHFDPERIDYWTIQEGAAAAASLAWPMAPSDSLYVWGSIKLVDRVQAHNEFASFGGRLTIARDGELHAALFRSEAPILSIGGHSGPADPLGIELCGYFGLLRAAAADKDINALIEAATPTALYAAFVVRTLAVYRARAAIGMPAPRPASLLYAETRRLEREHESDMRAGIQLASVL